MSANRDEAQFPQPDRFEIKRSPNDHVALGHGEHFCLGANLVRLELKVMLDEVLNRLPDLELAGTVQRLYSNVVAGIKHMPVRFTPPARPRDSFETHALSPTCAGQPASAAGGSTGT